MKLVQLVRLAKLAKLVLREVLALLEQVLPEKLELLETLAL